MHLGLDISHPFPPPHADPWPLCLTTPSWTRSSVPCCGRNSRSSAAHPHRLSKVEHPGPTGERLSLGGAGSFPGQVMALGAADSLRELYTGWLELYSHESRNPKAIFRGAKPQRPAECHGSCGSSALLKAKLLGQSFQTWVPITASPLPWTPLCLASHWALPARTGLGFSCWPG